MSVSRPLLLGLGGLALLGVVQWVILPSNIAPTTPHAPNAPGSAIFPCSF